MGTITIKDGISLAGTDGKLVTTAALNDAEGDEVALQLNYTTNKATSGRDTGLQIVWTDTASPGISSLHSNYIGSTEYTREHWDGSNLAFRHRGSIISQSIQGYEDQTLIVSAAGDGNNPAFMLTATNTPSLSFAQNALGVNFSYNSNAENALDSGINRGGAAIIKITNASTGIGRLRSEKDKREFGTHKTPGTGATVTEYGGAPTHTLSGTASNVSDATGHYVQLSGDGAAAGIDLAATECVKTEIDPVVTFIIKTGAALPTDATERIWVGLASASLAASDSPSGIHVAAFRYAIDTDNTAFWRCVTNDGGADAGTATTTTAAIAVGTRYRLTIDAEDSASIKFFVDGALVATHTTNLPTATQALGCTCLTVDAGAGTQEILVSKIHYETT